MPLIRIFCRRNKTISESDNACLFLGLCTVYIVYHRHKLFARTLMEAAERSRVSAPPPTPATSLTRSIMAGTTTAHK